MCTWFVLLLVNFNELLKYTCSCLFQLDGPFSYLESPVSLQSSNVPGVCSFDIERRMTAFSTISAKQRELEGRKVFFRVKFLQYPAGPVTFSNTAGPFYFPGKYQSLRQCFEKH